ncbi:MAG: hypothetical protein V3T17_07115 [Pseudomonadales bacterium]
MSTNEEHLKYIENEIRRTGKLIEEQEREPELKDLAGKVRSGDVSVDSLIPGVMELDPQKEEKLCKYYIALFSEFERLKRDELSAKNRGLDAHHNWLKAICQQNNETISSTKVIAKNVAEKIAASGVTAGLIWLGKTIIENWPFGYSYAEKSELSDGNSNE